MIRKKQAEKLIVLAIFMLGGISASFAEGSAEIEKYPDLEMLEYLGSWETEEGDWFDPLELFELAENSLNTLDEKRRNDD